MCGINFILGAKAQQSAIDEMIAAQVHRGPDKSGSAVFEQGDTRVALGHNRLSIIDLSDAGTQPMSSASGRYSLTFNGEIYNYKALRAELSDYPYRSSTDTEVLLAAWEKWGVDCLPKLVGMFAFSLWDNVERTLTIARDWIGIKPLYLACHNQSIFGASEIKTLLAVGAKAEPDWEIWGDYFRYGVYNHSDRTFFSDIISLSAGHYMVLTAADAQKGVLPASHSYWSIPEFEYRDNISEEDLSEELWEKLQENVSLHLQSDAPLGLNLSGGMDSATLCLLMDHVLDPDRSISSFTMGYGSPDYDEMIYADLVIPKSRNWNRHEVIFTPQECADNFYGDVFSLEEPVGGIATQAYKKLHKYASAQGIKVLLEGQGVDELLGGYGHYKSLLNADNQDNAVVDEKGTPLFYQDNSKFLAPELIAENGPITESTLRNFDSPFPTAAENAMSADLFHRRVPRVLRMNDRLSMAHGIELREPFLTSQLAEFCFTVPLEYKVKPHQAKSLLKTCLDKRAPAFAKTCENKRGVSAPQREWLQHDLKEFTWDILKSKKFTEIGAFDVPGVHKAYEEYLTHGGDNSFFIWQWINIAVWLDVFQAKA